MGEKKNASKKNIRELKKKNSFAPAELGKKHVFLFLITIFQQ